MIVVDASVVLELLLQSDRGLRAADRILDPQERIHAPHLIDIEIAQALRRLFLLKKLPPDRAQVALSDYLALAIERHGHVDLLSRVWRLRDTLTAYDASYIALAEALKAPLLTCDAKLARAQGHDAVVELC